MKKQFSIFFSFFLFFLTFPFIKTFAVSPSYASVQYWRNMSNAEITKNLELRGINPANVHYDYLRATGFFVKRSNFSSNSQFDNYRIIDDYKGRNVTNILFPNQGNPGPDFFQKNYDRYPDGPGALVKNPCTYTDFLNHKPINLGPLNCNTNGIDLTRVYDQFQDSIENHTYLKLFATVEIRPQGYSPGSLVYYKAEYPKYLGDHDYRYATAYSMPPNPTEQSPVDFVLDEVPSNPLLPNPVAVGDNTTSAKVRVTVYADKPKYNVPLTFKWANGSTGCVKVTVPNSFPGDVNWAIIDLSNPGSLTACSSSYSKTIADTVNAPSTATTATLSVRINTATYPGVVNEIKYDDDGDPISDSASGVNNNNTASLSTTLRPPSNDFEVLDLSLSPAPAQKSGTPVTKVTAKIKSTFTTDKTNVKITYKWGSGNNTATYCEVIDLIPRNSTENYELHNGTYPLCPGSPTTGLTYPYSTGSAATFTTPFIVEVNPSGTGRITESGGNYTNNRRTENIDANGLNASITNATVSTSASSATITTKVANNMFKRISNPCSTTSNVNELCRGASYPSTFTINIYKSSGALVGSIASHSPAFSSIADDSTLTINSTMAGLSPGNYRADIQIPQYAYEYNYGDNFRSVNFTVSLPTIPPPPPAASGGGNCKQFYSNVANYSQFNRFCVTAVPNNPSTISENGKGTYFKIEYRLLPFPVPAYSTSSPSSLSMSGDYLSLNEYDKNKDGYTNTFLYRTTARSTHQVYLRGSGYRNITLYNERGRVFPKTIKLNVKLLDPKGNVVPESTGTITYNVPTSCYDYGQLDIAWNCSVLTIYAGKNPTRTISGNYTTVPTDQNRFDLKNAGKYTYVIDTVETQNWRYQTPAWDWSCYRYAQEWVPGYWDESGYWIWSPETGWAWLVTSRVWVPGYWYTYCAETQEEWMYWYGNNPHASFMQNITNYKESGSRFGISSWTNANDMYHFDYDFPVTGTSAGSGRN